MPLPTPILPDPSVKPEFFAFSDNTVYSREGPWARHITVASKPRLRKRYALPDTQSDDTVIAHIGEAGATWPDIIGSRGGTFGYMVSECVVDALVEAGITGIDTTRVMIAKIDAFKLRTLPAPGYFILRTAGRMNFGRRDRARFGMSVGSRKAPLPNTWDGSDVFLAGNSNSLATYCTEKILLLAREQQWTNFGFTPIDVFNNLNVGWKTGIEYLSPVWPPHQWYPPRPSAGKTLDQWLDVYGAAVSGPQIFEAYRALLDLDDVESTVREAIARYRAANGAIRFRWARLLDEALCSYRSLLPDDILEALQLDRWAAPRLTWYRPGMYLRYF